MNFQGYLSQIQAIFATDIGRPLKGGGEPYSMGLAIGLSLADRLNSSNSEIPPLFETTK